MSLARQILLCIEDFQEQHPTLSSAWSQKLDYADSDLLRIGNIVRRLRQFLRVRAGQPFEEVPITIRDLQYAVHSWCRQIEYYSALIRADERGHEERTSEGGDPKDVQTLVMKMLLQATPSTTENQNTHTVRNRLRGRLANICEKGSKDERKKKSNGPANTVIEAVRTLASSAVLETREEKKSGHTVIHFKERKWAEITDSSTATEMCRSLRISSEHFPQC